MYARARHAAATDEETGSTARAPGKAAPTDGLLPAAISAPMGALLGHDVSNVTVHQDGQADALGTRAFARGDELHFAAGAYQPESADGRALLGHELAHVAQQREGRVAPTGAAGGMAVNTDPALEAEADASGAKVAQGFDLDGFLDFGVAASGRVAAPVAQGEDLPATTAPAATAAPVASGAPPEVMARIGAEFHHADDVSATRRYRVTPSGGFLMIACSTGRGVGVEFTPTSNEAAWTTLCAYVAKHAAEIPATTPAAPDPAAGDQAGGDAGAAAPGFFDDPLGAIGGAISGAVEGAIGVGRAILGLPSDIINAALDLLLGEAPAADPAVAPGAEPAAPGAEPAAPGAEPGSPPGTDEAVSADMPGMSQARWYGSGGAELNVDEVYAAAQLIKAELGLGGDVQKVTEPSSKVKGKSGFDGYFWFDVEGKPVKNGYAGGTQYITFTVASYSSTANPLSLWLADDPPGQRPAELVYDGKPRQASAELQNLPCRNIPGGMACFATSQAMMAQAGFHAVGNGDDAEIRDIITSETYRPYSEAELEEHPDPAERKAKVKREITAVTVDAAKAEKARAYVDFETGNGRPVLCGISYTDRNCNTDGETDHWVVINAKAGAGQYTFYDPGNSLPEAVMASSNLFTWENGMLHKEIGTYLYVVSWIRPNQESLEAWSAHWAQLQAGGAAPAGGEEKAQS